MMKAGIILSTLLNLFFLGVFGGAYFLREDDATFAYQFMIEMDPEVREVLKSDQLLGYLKRAQGEGAQTVDEFLKLIEGYAREDATSEALKKLLGDDPVVGMQRLLTVAASSQRQALAASRNEYEVSVERTKMLLAEFPDLQRDFAAREEDLKNREKDLAVRIARMEAMENDDRLKRAITAINEEKKAEDAVVWLRGLPVAEQYFIIKNLAEPARQTAILNALDDAEQTAIKNYKPQFSPNASGIEVGKGTSTSPQGE
ncbi:MAG: hypothetical protein KDB07_00710 [Planctomycetes bacterium]|nr:hypothetical protein [Planctomycetota bacterium]